MFAKCENYDCLIFFSVIRQNKLEFYYTIQENVDFLTSATNPALGGQEKELPDKESTLFCAVQFPLLLRQKCGWTQKISTSTRRWVNMTVWERRKKKLLLAASRAWARAAKLKGFSFSFLGGKGRRMSLRWIRRTWIPLYFLQVTKHFLKYDNFFWECAWANLDRASKKRIHRRKKTSPSWI